MAMVKSGFAQLLVGVLFLSGSAIVPTVVKAQDSGAAIRLAVESSQRSAKSQARDVYRHPAETLNFFGLRPNMTVVELWPGGGWFTEILAPILADKGKLIVTNFDPNSPDKNTAAGAKRFNDKLTANPKVFSKVQVATIDPPSQLRLGPDGSADMVLTFRNIHNWVSAGYEAQIYKAAFNVLKSGGILGVEEHRAAASVTDGVKSADNGYMPEAYVIQKIEAAGFKLLSKSEINANPKDTKNYKGGVWTLPPTLTLGQEDRGKYLLIGESDRMTLKFVKP
ncbi:MAG: class I SAM-dependent methyltransferase [Anaerolineae bacterium]|nr:class I SAM-dependent methyltransferase [Gloeobacterales cyanobacterium ES-bin-313]